MDSIAPETERMKNFNGLTPEEREEAIRMMWRGGFGAYQIATATGISIEAILAIIGTRKATA